SRSAEKKSCFAIRLSRSVIGLPTTITTLLPFAWFLFCAKTERGNNRPKNHIKLFCFIILPLYVHNRPHRALFRLIFPPLPILLFHDWKRSFVLSCRPNLSRTVLPKN